MKMNNKTQMIIVVVLIFILWIVIPAYIINKNNQPDPNIGANVVIKSDTLMVVGFDEDTQNYILEDRRQVAERMVELFKIED